MASFSGADIASGLGLRADEVRDRVARGLVNDVPDQPSRTLGQIVRANVFTRFNAILGVLLLVILVVGPLQDALFGFVVVSNAAIGIVQEWRAKRSLDRLALLTAPSAHVVRDGKVQELLVSGVVLDDVLELRPGDQVVVDGVVLSTAGLEVDESLLSGESEPVDKAAGSEVLSGSFVAAGAGRYRATRVGREAYAKTLVEEAQRFSLVRSELRAGVDRILRAVTWVMLPVVALLVYSQLVRKESVADAVRGSVAGVGSMVPEGLVLLTSVAFAVGVVRLGRPRVLVQELPAIGRAVDPGHPRPPGHRGASTAGGRHGCGLPTRAGCARPSPLLRARPAVLRRVGLGCGGGRRRRSGPRGRLAGHRLARGSVGWGIYPPGVKLRREIENGEGERP